VHYIEGCSAPIYSKVDLHAGVVEAFVGNGATLKFTTIQNWSRNVLNIGNKRAVIMRDAFVDWVDANMGAGLNVKYPTVVLSGRGARAQTLSLSMASDGQLHDTGARMIHLAPDTASTITSKSVLKRGGTSVFRGQVRVEQGAERVKARSKCDSLLLSSDAFSDTVPSLEVGQHSADVGHEATVSRLGQDQLFYLMSRGLTEEEATLTVVNGFVADFIRTLPMEYALEMNRLIELEMKGAQG
jgi:Fe-S cluster assembly protein SufB